MVRLPWWGSDEEGDDGPTPAQDIGHDPVVACEFSRSSLFVYEDHVHIERAGGSNFEDRSIPLDEVTGVEFSEGITVGYLQVVQDGFHNDRTGFLQAPVDANTCHFSRGDRECAREARDAILGRATG